ARSIEIRYTALRVPDPSAVHFRYRLEGSDSDWIDAGARRTAFYGNLKPGFYVFTVSASTGGDQWMDSSTLMLEQLPYFYQTYWFILLVSLSIASLAFFMHRLRLQNEVARVQAGFEERMDERTRIAQELHDTVVQAISGSTMLVANAAEKIPDSLPVVKGALLRAVDKLDAALNESRAALKGLRGSGATENNLARQLSHVANDTLAAGTTYRLVITGDSCALRPAIQYEVFRIGAEAITNALRHSGANSVQVELDYENGLRMVVRDDGNGIPEQVLDSGKDGHFGLEGMRGRAERMGATLSVSSRAGAGTEVCLMIPGHVAFEASASNSALVARTLSRIRRLRRRL
ncbi:MAG TPA: ATP-binding protein, partial [Candidatus Sulfotelmatobacter sp.]|nr:ATP-binding protein [Candidatus Sulfotelmatobacter sp.]